MHTVNIAIPVSGRLPQVRILDADALHLDHRALRNLARALTSTSGAMYVSRSYSFPYALVAWHSEPIGIDIERIGPCDSSFAELICTQEERLAATGRYNADSFLTSLWSSKEALAKGLGDALRYEPSRLESPARWPSKRAGAWHAEEVVVDSAYVAWVCWRSNELSDPLSSGASKVKVSRAEPADSKVMTRAAGILSPRDEPARISSPVQMSVRGGHDDAC